MPHQSPIVEKPRRKAEAKQASKAPAISGERDAEEQRDRNTHLLLTAWRLLLEARDTRSRS